MEKYNLKTPSKEKIKEEKEKIKKIRECYIFLLANVNDENLRKKINELSKEHILSIIDEVSYSVQLPAQNRIRELDDELKKLKKE